MKWMKTVLITLALLAGSSGIALAQEGYGGQDRDHDGDRANQNQHERDEAYRNNHRVYNRGVYQNNDGDRDDRNPNRGVYRGQYPVYNGQYPVYGGQYPVYGGQYPVYGGQYPVYGGQYPVYGGQYPVYGNQSPYYGAGMQQAQQNGYQYGLHDGQVDRQANRSYRATSNESYRKGSIGYVSAYGNKAQYESAFRQAYMQGYQQGYGSAGYGPYGQGRRAPWGR